MAERKVWDVIVVGGGAAGFTAALYASRRALTTCIIAKDVGGQALLTQHIENYPGILAPVTGPELLQNFWKQAERHGAKTTIAEVTGIEQDGDIFIVRRSDGQEEYARAVILAFGMTPINMNVPGEKEFTGRGVHYCATCDAPLYTGKTVAVVGGTNGAMDAALLLAKICPKVYMVYKREKLVGDSVMVKQIEASRAIQFLGGCTPKEVRGGDHATTLVISGVEGDKELFIDGVFVEMGYAVKTDFVRHLVDLNQKNEILVDANMHTRTPGLFACGDVVACDYKQLSVSAGQGTIAALEAYKYLQTKAGKPSILIDWT